MINYKDTPQESYDYFMGLKSESKDKNEIILRTLKINWMWVQKILTKSKIKIDWNIFTPSWFQEFINILFEWQNIDKNKYLYDYFIKYENNTPQENYDYFMCFN